MIIDTPKNRWIIRSVITGFSSWGHVCLGYTALNVWRFWPDLYEHVTPWRTYCALEAGFVLFFVWYRRVLQQPAIHPPSRSKEERRALFDKLLGEIHDPVRFLRGWFKGAEIKDIGVKELREFLIWSFWDGRVEEVDEDELDYYFQRVQQMSPELSFREGSSSAKGLRLSVDPFEIESRTLLWYGLIMGFDTYMFHLFSRKGYRYYGTASNRTIFPPRIGTFIQSRPTAAKKVSYWITRPHTSKTRLPIVYFHGIGVGLYTYADWIHRLDQALNAGRGADDQVAIVMLELPYISSRLSYYSIPRKAELLEEFTTILDHHNIPQFVLAGHSYGSIFSTYILRDPKLSSRVVSSLLVDPVAIMLHMPDVAYNFTVRAPTGANEWQLWYFASKDPGVAHTLGRNFFWYENVLWRDEIFNLIKKNNLNITVSLGSDDLIVDAEGIGSYLMENKIPDPVIVENDAGVKHMELRPAGGSSDDWKNKKWTGKGLEIMWWQGVDHANVYKTHESSEELIKVLVEYCRNGSSGKA